MGPPLTKRIIVCVDGTWYNADGQEGKLSSLRALDLFRINGVVGRGQGNNSNVFRIFASIKHGEFEERGRKIKQVRAVSSSRLSLIQLNIQCRLRNTFTV